MKLKAAALLAALFLAGAGFASADEEGEGGSAHPAVLTMGGLFLFYNEQGPLSFVASVPGEAPKDRIELGEVFGRSCQHGVSIRTGLSLNATSVSGAAGNGGYFKALDGIRKEHPTLAGIYDVKVDLRALSILGIYQRLCTEVSARGFALK